MCVASIQLFSITAYSLMSLDCGRKPSCRDVTVLAAAPLCRLCVMELHNIISLSGGEEVQFISFIWRSLTNWCSQKEHHCNYYHRLQILKILGSTYCIILLFWNYTPKNQREIHFLHIFIFKICFTGFEHFLKTDFWAVCVFATRRGVSVCFCCFWRAAWVLCRFSHYGSIIAEQLYRDMAILREIHCNRIVS